MTAGYGWWYGTYSAIPRSSQHTVCFKICGLRLTLRRLPRPRCPSPRRFLPKARGRACRSSWPEISDNTSRNKISYVLRSRGCIEGCWSWDQVYHRRGGSPESIPYRNQPSQHRSQLLIPSHSSLDSIYSLFSRHMHPQNFLHENHRCSSLDA